MKSFVVDASVGAKWFLPATGEPLAAEAQALLDHYTLGRVRLLVPDFFWAELGNVLWNVVGSLNNRLRARLHRRASWDSLCGLRSISWWRQ
jgi:predicted nucleic acid-binding protein